MNAWQRTKLEWKKVNPPDEHGYYICALCKHTVHTSKMSLDHKISKSLYPELKYDLDNLQPTHVFCNQEKGNGVDGGTGVIRRYGRFGYGRRRRR